MLGNAVKAAVNLRKNLKNLRSKVSEDEREFLTSLKHDQRFEKKKKEFMEELKGLLNVGEDSEIDLAALIGKPLAVFASDCVRLSWETFEDEKIRLASHEKQNEKLVHLILESQEQYLKEVSSLRDRLRAAWGKSPNPIEFAQDEIYFYDPIKLLEPKLQEVVKLITIEKVKLELQRFGGGSEHLVADINRLTDLVEKQKKEFEMEIANLKKTIEFLKEQDVESKELIKKLQKDLEDRDKVIQKLEAENKELRERLQSPSPSRRTEQVKEVPADTSELDSKILELQAEIDSLKIDKLNLQKRIAELEKAIALAQKAQSAPVQASDDGKAAAASTASLDALRREKDQEIARLKALLKEMENKLAEASKRPPSNVATSSPKYVAPPSNDNELLARLEAAERELEASRVTIVEKEERITVVEKELAAQAARFKEELDQAVAAEIKKIKKKHADQLAAAKIRQEQLEQENAELKTMIDELHKRLAMLQEEMRKAGLGDLADKLLADAGLSKILAAYTGKVKWWERLYDDARDRELRREERLRAMKVIMASDWAIKFGGTNPFSRVVKGLKAQKAAFEEWAPGDGRHFNDSSQETMIDEESLQCLPATDSEDASPVEEVREMKYTFVHSCIACGSRSHSPSRVPSRDVSPAPAVSESQRPQSKAGMRSRSPSPPQQAVMPNVVTVGQKSDVGVPGEDFACQSCFPVGQVLLTAPNVRPATSPPQEALPQSAPGMSFGAAFGSMPPPSVTGDTQQGFGRARASTAPEGAKKMAPSRSLPSLGAPSTGATSAQRGRRVRRAPPINSLGAPALPQSRGGMSSGGLEDSRSGRPKISSAAAASRRELMHTGDDAAEAAVEESPSIVSKSLFQLRQKISPSQRLEEMRKLEKYPRRPGTATALCEGFYVGF